MKTIIWAILMMTCAYSSISQKNSDWNFEADGYVKSLNGVLYNSEISSLLPYITDNLLHNRLNFRADFRRKIVFNASLRSRVFWGDVIRLNDEFAEQIESGNNDQWDLSYHLVDKETWLINTNLDRLNIKFEGEKFDLTIGRQRINWGINSFWNPNDLFNAYSFVDFDYQERPGTDALHFQYYIGDQQNIELAANQFSHWDEAIIAGKWNSNIKTYDIQLLLGYYLENIVLGAGWAGNLKNASLKGEVAYFHDLNEEGRDGLSFTTGVDHILENGLLIGGGMLFNDLGTSKSSFNDLLNFNLSPKNLYPYKWSGYITSQYSITPLLSAGASVVFSMAVSQPVFFSPVLSYSMATNWDIDLTSQWLFQKTDVFKLDVALATLRTRWSF